MRLLVFGLFTYSPRARASTLKSLGQRVQIPVFGIDLTKTWLVVGYLKAKKNRLLGDDPFVLPSVLLCLTPLAARGASLYWASLGSMWLLGGCLEWEEISLLARRVKPERFFQWLLIVFTGF